GSLQSLLQLTLRFLTGTDDDGIYRQHLRLATGYADVQAGIIDLHVLDTIEHLHILALQPGAVNPPGSLAQAITHLGFLALQQVDLTRSGMRLRLDPGDTTARIETQIDAPFLPEGLTIQAARFALMGDQLGHVKTDTTGTDHRHLLTYRLALENRIEVTDHLG